MNLPRKRVTPRRAAHPIRPPGEHIAPTPAPDPRLPGAPPRRPGAKRSPEQRARRADHVEAQRDDRDDFRARVLAATPGGFGDCGYWEDGTWHAGTPGCQQWGPHRGNEAHHRHIKGMGGKGGGSNATTNGAWLCAPGHRYVHGTNNRLEAERLGLLRRWSDPWPPIVTEPVTQPDT